MAKRKPKVEHDYQTCSQCTESKRLDTEYYLANSTKIFKNGRLPICKDCMEVLIDTRKEAESLRNLMRMVDRPFISRLYSRSKAKNNPFREYMRLLAMPQYRDLNWSHSEFENVKLDHSSDEQKEIYENSKIDHSNFEVTEEMVVKWGDYYNPIQIQQLEKFFQDMERANEIQTPQHKAQLELLCKLHIAQNEALENGQYSDFQKINNQYNKTLENSGFRPIDRQGGGESSGLRTFSQIWEEIERDGFIKPTPIEENQDIVDKTILYMANYTRKLININSLSEPPSDTPDASGDTDES